jgi:hypothetical protein
MMVLLGELGSEVVEKAAFGLIPFDVAGPRKVPAWCAGIIDAGAGNLFCRPCL